MIISWLRPADKTKNALNTAPTSILLAGATFEIGMATLPMRSGDPCGDIPAFWVQGEQLFLWLADGLGHGANARIAAEAARSSVAAQLSLDVQTLFARCDEEIRETRGVTMGLCVLSPAARTLTFAGVGNIRARHLGETPHHFSCSYGIIGAGFKSLFVETASFQPGDRLILSTDGIPENFTPPFEENGGQSAQQWADGILSTSKLPTDDAGVLVCEWIRPRGVETRLCAGCPPPRSNPPA